MNALFIVALGMVLYTYAGYPLCIALLARLRPHPWMQAPGPRTASVIVPVHNGLEMLPARLISLLALDARVVGEILVVLDGCTDGSAEWLQQQNDPRLRTIILPRQMGKSAALSRAMAVAREELLLFIDIRPEVTEAAILQLFCNFADSTVGCVAGELRIRVDPQHNQTTSAVGGIYWRYEQWIRNCEAAYDSPVGVYGGFYAIRRSLAVLPPDGLILDDMFQPLSVIRKGYRSVVDRSAIVYDRWPTTSSGEFHRKVRTLAGNFQLVAQEPWLLTPKNRVLFQLVSHKLLRLLVPYCFVAMFFTACLLAVHSTAWLAVACLQLAFWLMGLIAMQVGLPMVGKIASAVSALLVLNAAAVRALWVYLFTSGPLWKIWTATPLPRPETRTL